MDGSEYADRYGVTLDYASHGAQVDESGWEHNAYTVTLAYGPPANQPAAYTSGGRKEVKVPWKQGYGVEGVPEVGTVIENLAMECASYDAQGDDFEDWAGEYGYDPDSRKAYATWQAIGAQHKALYDWCRSEAMWGDLLSVTEDEQ